MIQIDQRIETARLQQFADQIARIPPPVRHTLLECFASDQSSDFYAGLVAGLASAYQFTTIPNGRETIAAALALAAHQALRHQP